MISREKILSILLSKEAIALGKKMKKEGIVGARVTERGGLTCDYYPKSNMIFKNKKP